MSGVFIPRHRPYSNLSEEDLNCIIKTYSFFTGNRHYAASELRLRKQLLEQANKKNKT